MCSSVVFVLLVLTSLVLALPPHDVSARHHHKKPELTGEDDHHSKTPSDGHHQKRVSEMPSTTVDPGNTSPPSGVTTSGKKPTTPPPKSEVGDFMHPSQTAAEDFDYNPMDYPADTTGTLKISEGDVTLSWAPPAMDEDDDQDYALYPDEPIQVNSKPSSAFFADLEDYSDEGPSFQQLVLLAAARHRNPRQPPVLRQLSRGDVTVALF